MGLIVNTDYVSTLIIELNYVLITVAWILLWKFKFINKQIRKKVILFTLVSAALLDIFQAITISEIILGAFLIFWSVEILNMIFVDLFKVKK